MPKRTLRAQALARRKGIGSEEAAILSRGVQERFLALPEFRHARSLALYAAIHKEVETFLVAKEAFRLGKRVVFPAAVGDALDFREVSDLAELQVGRFGILEPPGESRAPGTLDLIVVPGIGFDREGRRLGYGKGFYDRALHQLEGTGRLVGFCYEFQLLPEIFGEPHDVVMDLIVTEQRVVRVHNNIGGIQL